MYVILVYDINLEEKEGQKVLRNVFKICKKYLVHIQNSVFEGDITEGNMQKLKTELKGIIKHEKDSILIYTFQSKKYYTKENIQTFEKGRNTNFYSKTLFGLEGKRKKNN